MKRFRSLKPIHLEGLSFWFWVRENMSFMNSEWAGIIGDYWDSPPKLFKGYKDWLWFSSLPFFYVLGIFIGPFLRKREAYEYARPDYEIFFYNKKNIEYITIVHTLSGGDNGY